MGLEQQPALDAPRPREDCAFCVRQDLHNILTESQSFFLLADHAPLIEGHILLVPKEHYSCYGALIPELEEEFLWMKARVAEFLSQTYRPPVFFEHGIFRQTVYHAHLHCFPFGPIQLDLSAYHPHPAPNQEDLREWHAQQGQYFYFEQRVGEGQLFLPEEVRYFSFLGALRKEATATQDAWRPSDERRVNGRPKIESLLQKWREFAQEYNTDESRPGQTARAQHEGDGDDGDRD
ncbi:MAG TPA: HIT domain-containing protein [Ktedonobacterales bacterium]|jgi:diadenosine tetraphosphate (Ap4A) HIT family hydrolase